MNQRSKIIIIAVLFLGLISVAASAHSKWFRKGKYHISMVHNGATNEDSYINPDVSDIWIEIGQDSVKVVKTSKIYTAEFGEGESLDMKMVPVSTNENLITYIIDHVDVKTNPDGSTNEYMVCRTADGVKCNLNIGSVGKGSKGSTVYGMQFTDPDFNPILWCFIEEDVDFYE